MSTMEHEAMGVGQLAEAAGVTVRTLHHWDAIGLLVPSARTHAGHRRYAPEDVRRLYRIVALRRLGLSLDAVATALEQEGTDLRAAVERHLAEVERRLAATDALRRRLIGLLDAFDGLAGEPSTAAFLQTIEVMTMHEQYYSDDQLAQLEERRTALGEEGMADAQRDWAELIAAVEAERAKGTDPADPRIQELAGRWEAMIQAFTGGDPGIRASLQRMYESEGAERASHGMVDPGLMAYVHQAMEARG